MERLSWITQVGPINLKGRQKCQSQRRCHDGSRSWSDVLTGFEDEKGPWAKECRQPLEAGNSKETRNTALLTHLEWDDKCVFLKQSVWWFIATATGHGTGFKILGLESHCLWFGRQRRPTSTYLNKGMKMKIVFQKKESAAKNEKEDKDPK